MVFGLDLIKNEFCACKIPLPDWMKILKLEAMQSIRVNAEIHQNLLCHRLD